MIDGNLRILKLSVGVQVPHAQLSHLAGGAADRRLVTFAARLGVVEWAESIGSDVFNFLEELLVGVTPVGTGKPVALVVEPGECFLCVSRCLSARIDCEANQDRSCEDE
jgi:hypothetical protein